MSSRPLLLPRARPTEVGIPAESVEALIDEIEARGVECHALMIVRAGHVIAESWRAPYRPQTPRNLYSVTKSFTAIAVGFAVDDGLLSLEDRAVALLPDHVPDDAPAQAYRLTVRHLLTMTAGHAEDSLLAAWQRQPHDLVRGFLEAPFAFAEGARHVYDNAATAVLARIVERVTGRGLDVLLDERLFHPMGIEHAEWERLADGSVFGFQGLHLTTEALAAFGQLLLQEGRWGADQLVPREWIRQATSRQIKTLQSPDGAWDVDSLEGYGYQFWMSREGFRADGAFGQLCMVFPAHDLVVAIMAGDGPHGAVVNAVHTHLLPALDLPGDTGAETRLSERLRSSAFPMLTRDGSLGGIAEGVIIDPDGMGALAEGTVVRVEPRTGGWRLSFGETGIEVGAGRWVESAPLGRPVVAAGAWQDGVFSADVFVITSPHRVRFALDPRSGTAHATWSTVPLTGSDLMRYLRSPLVTRPDVC